jgi:ABC-type amino acid transport substrate-binding protein
MGFVVRDHRRNEFTKRDVVAARDDLRVAVPNKPYYITRVERILPRAELVPVSSVREFLNAAEDDFDALVFVAEIGSAWSLLRPEFTVVVPEPPFQEIPLAYAVPSAEGDWLNTVDSWIALKRGDGTIQQLYDYWILGREAEQREPRWSVARDVLGWLD